MIWATVAEVREYLTDTTLLAGLDDAAVGRHIERAQRRLSVHVLWWPATDDTIDRVADEDERAAVVAAVAEVIRARRTADTITAALGGDAAAEVIAAGGSVDAGSLKVSGGSRSGGGTRLGSRASDLPREAFEAMRDAGMIGGGVASW